MSSQKIRLDGSSLTRAQVCAVAEGQAAFINRAKCNSAATYGKYSSDMEAV